MVFYLIVLACSLFLSLTMVAVLRAGCRYFKKCYEEDEEVSKNNFDEKRRLGPDKED